MLISVGFGCRNGLFLLVDGDGNFAECNVRCMLISVYLCISVSTSDAHTYTH